MARDVENLFAAAALFARGFHVVLNGSKRVGELVHLFDGRHTAMTQQLHFDETDDAVHQLRRLRQIQHAQRAGDFFEQTRNRFDARVIPRRFDERDDVLFGLRDVNRRFFHQRVENLSHFCLRQFEIVAGLTLIRRRVDRIGAEAFDVIVERRFDVKQCSCDIEQCVLSSAGRVLLPISSMILR